MLSRLKRRLRPIRLALRCLKGCFRKSQWGDVGDKVCWIVGSPDHRNLGDHAIAYATEKFVQTILPKYKVKELTEMDFYSNFAEMKCKLKPHHIIILQGGGNFGNEYLYTEDIRRVVVRFCKKNPIIMFPQTMYFTKDVVGEIEKNYTKKLYNKNLKIKFFAREKYTEKVMLELFDKDSVSCVPDIVLTLHNSNIVSKAQGERKNILYCIRNDKEGALSQESKQKIENVLLQVGVVEKIDTISDNSISPRHREQELFGILKKFSLARLVVTDRLHGMVFAAITNTPCIVFSNYNTKVSGVYDWIKALKNIVYVENLDDLNQQLIEETINAKEATQEEWKSIDNAFLSLRKALLEGAKSED